MTNQQIARLVSPTRKHVWLVAAPKSGSTWLGAMLDSVFGWPRVPLLDCYDRREQEVDVRMLLQHPNVDIFTPHQHTRASHPTLGIQTRGGTLRRPWSGGRLLASHHLCQGILRR